MRLRNKVAIVTGAGSGIGHAIALALAKEGANVVIGDVKEDSARTTATEIEAMRRKTLVVKCDVRSSSEVENMVQKTLEKFGKINILVNNAGVSTMALVVDMTEEEWDFNLDVNAKGAFLCSRAVARQMIKQGEGGKIINLGSIAGKSGEQYYAHYNASKAAVIAFTASLARELAPYKINVNAVCPGSVQTSMQLRELKWGAKLRGMPEEEIKEWMVAITPLGRLEQPEDVAKLVVFLASEEADFITGQAINVDGGIMTRR
jgi:acetoin reductase-like protein